MKYFRLLIVTFVFCILSSAFVGALTLKPLNLQQLVALSPTIARVTLLEITYEEVDYKGATLMGANFTFRVDELLKGEADDTLVIMQLAQLSEDGWGISSRGNVGVPEYEIGQPYLLFLSDPSERTGFTATVGLSQGTFHLKKQNGKWLIPGLSKKKSLVRNMQKKGMVKALISSQGSLTEDYQTFKTVIKDLVEGE